LASTAARSAGTVLGEFLSQVVFQVVGLLAHHKAVFLGLLALAVTAIMVLLFS